MMKLKPRITEKAYATISEEKGAANQYTFVVPRTARKEAIKREVEEQFKVHVEDIRVINLPPKKRRFRGKLGFTQMTRKAIVRLKKGETIATFDIQTEEKPAEEAAKE